MYAWQDQLSFGAPFASSVVDRIVSPEAAPYREERVMFRHVLALVLAWALVPSTVFAQAVEEHATEIIHPPSVKDTQQAKPDLSEVADQIIQKTNRFRQAEKRPEVRVNAKLAATAQYFA